MQSLYTLYETEAKIEDTDEIKFVKKEVLIPFALFYM